jgi:acyl carrier protein/nodulation protein F
LEIVDEVRRIIAKTLDVPVGQLSADTRLDALGVASIDVIEIVYEIEDKYGISIPLQPGEGTPVLQSETKGFEPMELGPKTIAELADAVRALVDAKSA